jgi:transcriptional regulator with XRE-family HTH domain
MTEQAIIDRIKSLCADRKWTVYRLSKASGITYSTLCTKLGKANAPSMVTFLKICNGFGITPKQFFDVDDDSASLTDEQRRHLALWEELSGENKVVAEKYIRFLASEQA